MPDQTKLYISVESSDGHLVITGPMVLWRELIATMAVTMTPKSSQAARGAALKPVAADARSVSR